LPAGRVGARGGQGTVVTPLEDMDGVAGEFVALHEDGMVRSGPPCSVISAGGLPRRSDGHRRDGRDRREQSGPDDGQPDLSRRPAPRVPAHAVLLQSLRATNSRWPTGPRVVRGTAGDE